VQLLDKAKEGLTAPLSYNVLLWSNTMLVVPRSQEHAGPCAIK
jgi:ATP adenylyltransferase/5',5'''-P-1,P-4-tetraphosphate phosphorylase II